MKVRFGRFIPAATVVAVMLFASSCQFLNQNIMLRTPKGYVFDTLAKDTTIRADFMIGMNDILEFRLFANDGVKMVDVLSNRSDQSLISRTEYQYNVDSKGMVKLPIIGMEYVAGMSLREAEAFLEQRYSEYYVAPFVALKVINRRVIVYPGNPGDAQVISLGNANTTVLEAIASVGGISENGKANNIKLIRQTNDPKKPVKVYKIDLSTIYGLADGNTVLISNDIIYVEPRRQYVKRTLGEVGPVITLITTLITFYYVITRLH